MMHREIAQCIQATQPPGVKKSKSKALTDRSNEMDGEYQPRDVCRSPVLCSISGKMLIIIPTGIITEKQQKF